MATKLQPANIWTDAYGTTYRFVLADGDSCVVMLPVQGPLGAHLGGDGSERTDIAKQHGNPFHWFYDPQFGINWMMKTGAGATGKVETHLGMRGAAAADLDDPDVPLHKDWWLPMDLPANALDANKVWGPLAKVPVEYAFGAPVAAMRWTSTGGGSEVLVRFGIPRGV